MSRAQDQALMDEAFAEAKAMIAVECPDADLSALPGVPEAVDVGIWFGMAAAASTLGHHGHIRRRR